jgi:predicted nuclease of predicted toxin-antitoxin system
VKFYLDEDLSPKIALALRKKGIDAVSAHDQGNVQFTDAEQLAYAAGKGRCLVTRNARHFLVLSGESINRQRPHAGILLCSPRFTGAEIRMLVKRLVRIAHENPRGFGPYDIFYL